MSFDKSHYSIHIDGFENTFTVLSFHLQESIAGLDNLSVITLCDEMGLEYDELIGKSVSFTFEHFGHEQHFHGLIFSFEEEPTDSGQSKIMIHVEPHLNLLGLSKDCRVYRNQDVISILKETLLKCQITGSLLEVNVSANNKTLDFCVQYNESDYAFFNRMASRFGIHYYLRHDPNHAVLVLAETNDSFVSGVVDDLQYVPASGMGGETAMCVSQLKRRQKIQIGTTKVKGYNYSTPNLLPVGESGNAELVKATQFDSDQDSDDSAKQIADWQMEASRAIRALITGISPLPDLRVGHCFSLVAGSSSTGFEADYVIVKASHSGSQEAAITGVGTDTPYRNSFSALPKKIPFRLIPNTNASPINGVIVAKVEGEENDYAKIDDQGRYTIKLPFDEIEHSSGNSSCPVRMAQPHSGPGFGHHFPLHKGADVVLAFENGDINKPILMGSTPNPNQSSPVNQKNRFENIISTKSGHKLVFDDSKNSTKVHLTTAGGLKLLLDDTKKSQGITLSTPNKHQFELSEQNSSLSIGIDSGSYNLHMDKVKQSITLGSSSGSQLLIDDQSKKVELVTSNGLQLKLDEATNKILISDGGGSNLITIDSSQNKIILKSSGKMEVESVDSLIFKSGKNISFEATDTFEISAAQVAIQAKQNVKVEGSMGVDVASGKDISIKAQMNGELSAGVQQVVTSNMTTLEGQAMTTIQGAMVKIN